MPQDAFDSAEVSAMTRAIEIIVGDIENTDDDERQIAARAVFKVASESREFDSVRLAELARARLSAERTRH